MLNASFPPSHQAQRGTKGETKESGAGPGRTWLVASLSAPAPSSAVRHSTWPPIAALCSGVSLSCGWAEGEKREAGRERGCEALLIPVTPLWCSTNLRGAISVGSSFVMRLSASGARGGPLSAATFRAF